MEHEHIRLKPGNWLAQIFRRPTGLTHYHVHPANQLREVAHSSTRAVSVDEARLGQSIEFKLYASAVILIGGALLLDSLWNLDLQREYFLPAGMLTVLAAGSVFLPVRTLHSRAYFNAKPAFIFAAVVILPPTWLAPIIVVARLPWMLFHKVPRRFLEPVFNIAQYTISARLASLVFYGFGTQPPPPGSLASLLSLAGAVAVFLFTQTGLVTVMVMLYRQVSLRETEGLNLNNLLVDFLMLCVGAIMGTLWQIGPWVSLLALAPLSGLYLVLRLSKDVSYLKEVDRLKTSIVANVSHELRTPLASIKLYGQLLQNNIESSDPGTRQRFLDIIDQQTDRLVELIDDLLDLSRIESGQFEAHKEPLYLQEMIDEVVNLMSIQAQRRNLVLHTDVDPDLPALLADRELMRILFKNLLSNAIKFSHEGGRIDILGQQLGGKITFSVIDQGIGIPQEALPHIFEKFYRVQTSTESGIQGTGLGLVLAKEAAEAHGGVIRVESELGKGSKFTLELPLPEESVNGKHKS